MEGVELEESFQRSIIESGHPEYPDIYVAKFLQHSGP